MPGASFAPAELKTSVTRLARLFKRSPCVIGYAVAKGETIAAHNRYEISG